MTRERLCVNKQYILTIAVVLASTFQQTESISWFC